VFHQALFLFTGFYQSIAAQYLYYQGAATGTSLLTNTAQYVGMASVGFLLLPGWWAKRKRRRVIIEGSNELEFDLLDIDHKKTRSQNDYQLISNVADEETLADDASMLGSTKLSELKEFINYKFIFAASLLDIIANFTLTIGFFYVGSGMFQVIYSSVVVWCAVLSFLFLGRKLSLLQSLSIIGVFFGLALSALGVSQDSDHEAPPPATSTGPALLHSFNMSSTMFGMLLTSIATFGYACVYVVTDQLVSIRTPNTLPLNPEKACFLVGSGCTGLSLMYITLYTIPNWDKLVTQEMAKKVPHASDFIIVLTYLVLIVASFVHNFAYYWLMKRLGNVSTGLLNSIRAIVVFGLSHILFCGIDSGQCFNVWKGWSTIVVIGFVT
ncbi:5929_t:CDS:2, partial [Acaulospora morrowiae]